MRNLTYLKHFPKMLSILMSVIFLFTSCSKDVMDDFINEDNNTEVTDPSDPEDGGEETDPVDPGSGNDFSDLGEINTTPCDYDLSSLSTGETLVVDCTIDLNGNTVNLPADVTLDFNGGQIINGTLNFSGGKIAGELLNYQMEITGEVSLISSEFNFYPSRWDIVQGKVDDVTARNNRDHFEQLIFIVKGLGAKSFHIDDFDGFFKVDQPLAEATPSEAAINIPSDFTLKMTQNTHLRMQPNAYKQPTLLCVTDNASNVIIDGGNLHGDREEHDYSDNVTDHGWGHLLRLKGCHDVVVQNVYFIDATGDGINVSGENHAFSPNYNPTYNALIKNNTFLRNRRLHISITSGHHVTVEENEFIDASIDMNNSKGTSPGFAIDVEAVRGADGTEYEIAEDITIRNNTERGSRVGAITVHTGDRVTIENNELENTISYSTSIGTIIRNNTLLATTDMLQSNGTAITAGRNDRYDRNWGNKVYGNKISGFSTGIMVSNKDLEVYENEIDDCKSGIVLNTLETSNIYDNIISSEKSQSKGIVSGPLSEYIISLNLSGNIVNVSGSSVLMIGVNKLNEISNDMVTFQNNDFKNGGVTISDARGVSFKENILNANTRIVNSSKINYLNNFISVSNASGIRIDSGCENLSISGNEISVMDPHSCIQQTSSDGVNINIDNNSCN